MGEDTAASDTGMVMERAPPRLRPSPRLLPTMDMAATALTAMARGPLMPRLTTEDSATDPTAMESAPLTPRLTTDSDTDLTAMERGLLMPRLTTEDSATDPMATASVLPTPRLTMDSDMDLTVMERGPLMPRPTTEDSDTAPTDMARGQPMLRLTTEDSATDPTDMASKRFTTDGEAQPKLKIIAKRKSKSGIKPKLHPGTKSDPRTDMIREFCNLLHETKINICTSW